MSRRSLESQSPMAPARTTSIRKLTRILRPARRTPAQPRLLIPGPDADSISPPSSPSLYSLSSDTEPRAKLSSETGPEVHSAVSPTLNALSSSASEGHDNASARRALSPVDLALPGLENDQPEPISPTRPSRRPQRSSADITWATNREYRVRPQRIIISDKEDMFINSDASSLRGAGKWDGELTSEPLAPAEWLSSKKALQAAATSSLSLVESENRSPNGSILSSPSASSPATPRARPTAEMDRPTPTPQAGETFNLTRNPTIAELRASGQHFSGHFRRPRSASEPRSYFGRPLEIAPHAGTVPSTPTMAEYKFKSPTRDDSGPKPISSPTTAATTPPPRRSPLSSTYMPEDVYFTAAGRRESRMYMSPDAAPHQITPFSSRSAGHAHTNSEPPALHLDLDPSSPSVRYATWNAQRKREPTQASARPFEDAGMHEEEAAHDFNLEDINTPVSRKEAMWTGQWNRGDIQDVIRELRTLR